MPFLGDSSIDTPSYEKSRSWPSHLQKEQCKLEELSEGGIALAECWSLGLVWGPFALAVWALQKVFTNVSSWVSVCMKSLDVGAGLLVSEWTTGTRLEGRAMIRYTAKISSGLRGCSSDIREQKFLYSPHILLMWVKNHPMYPFERVGVYITNGSFHPMFALDETSWEPSWYPTHHHETSWQPDSFLQELPKQTGQQQHVCYCPTWAVGPWCQLTWVSNQVRRCRGRFKGKLTSRGSSAPG